MACSWASWGHSGESAVGVAQTNRAPACDGRQTYRNAQRPEYHPTDGYTSVSCSPCAGIIQIRFRRSVAKIATLSAWFPKLPLRSVSIQLSDRSVPRASEACQGRSSHGAGRCQSHEGLWRQPSSWNVSETWAAVWRNAAAMLVQPLRQNKASAPLRSVAKTHCALATACCCPRSNATHMSANHIASATVGLAALADQASSPTLFERYCLNDTACQYI